MGLQINFISDKYPIDNKGILYIQNDFSSLSTNFMRDNEHIVIRSNSNEDEIGIQACSFSSPALSTDAFLAENDTSIIEYSQETAVTVPQDSIASNEENVWVSKSGKKYHLTADCSGMKNPDSITLSEALAKGFTPCKKCYQSS